MSIALFDESALNKLSLTMTERIHGKKKNYRVGFYMKELRDRPGMAERRQRFSPCRELQHEDECAFQNTTQHGRRGSACDSERGYCSDPEHENSSVPESGAVHALLQSAQPFIHLHLKYQGSLESRKPIGEGIPTVTVSNAANTSSTLFGRKRISESDPIDFEEDVESSGDSEGTADSTMTNTNSQLTKVVEETENKNCSEARSDCTKDERNAVYRSSTFSTHRKPFRKSLKRRKRAEAGGNMLTLKPTLEDIVKNKAAMLAFRSFLKSEFSEENLDFWLECENYKTLKGSKQSRVAKKIFDEYVEVNAPKEVNLDSKLRDRTKTSVSKPDKATFTEAQKSIFNLMNSDSFRRFLNSPEYEKVSGARSKSPTKLKLFS